MRPPDRFLQRARNWHESMMRDLCVISRPGAGPSTTDPDTGVVTPPAATTVYDDPDNPGAGAKCRVVPTGNGAVVEAGEQPVSLWPYLVEVPIAATGFKVNDDVHLTASADPELAGAHLRIREVNAGSDITVRALSCDRNLG